MSVASSPDFEIGAATDPGRKRRGEPNQDALLVLPAESGRPPLLGVADGMGGHVGGAEASRLVVEAIAACYRHTEKIDSPPTILLDCLKEAHRVLLARAQERPDLASMGSTVALALITGGQVYAANVGDSRVYLLHGQEMIQLSYDHSVVADLVRAGQLTPLEALRSPKRNRLTQSLSPKRKEVTPFIAQAPFAEEDTLLLCSDGLWSVVSEAVIQAVTQELPPQEAAEKLMALVLAQGAPDNVTVVIARRRGAQKAKSYKEDETNPGL